MTAANKETREFQTEIKQLLDIVINSLYTNKQVFLRELISNAADAAEKMRYLTLTGAETVQAAQPLEIRVETDEAAHTLAISDNGVGMTREELVENLGVIAHSGSRSFIEAVRAGKEAGSPVDLGMIGQFGVGFYAAFMVAEKVILTTRSYRPEGENLIWTSEGAGSYDITPGGEIARGTTVLLQLKEDAYSFAKPDVVKQAIKQYSGFVPYPVFVNGEKVNTVEPIWMKNKNEIKDEEYTEFYKYTANAWDEPLYRLHFSSDAPLALNALLFAPAENLERFGFSRMERGVNLYCKKVLIQEKAEAITPEWMRFVRGVLDSADLPLNISRETLQDSALIAKLNDVITSRFIKFLQDEAKNDPAKYAQFWEKFGRFIKEGAANDFAHKNDLLKLMRFESSKKAAGELVSLAEYAERAPETQKAIYYVNGPNRETIESGPYLEPFRAADAEVLYTFDPVDDYILERAAEFEGKKLVAAEEDSGDLPPRTDAAEAEAEAADGVPAAERPDLTGWFKQILGEQVTEVRVSARLTDSPAVTLTSYGTHSMQRMMQLMDQKMADAPPGVLEINCAHPIIIGVNELRKKEDAFAAEAAAQVLRNAQLAAGLIFDPRSLVNKLNDVLARAVAKG
ncbi:MAG: molecular chaperone HtpG [Gracilibacteraceae bacterium]|jgi:molecular chaperone HtpG|nr:molecular chaperone HtpG [Gracilibacteraceae bacterium]